MRQRTLFVVFERAQERKMENSATDSFGNFVFFCACVPERVIRVCVLDGNTSLAVFFFFREEREREKEFLFLSFVSPRFCLANASEEVELQPNFVLPSSPLQLLDVALRRVRACMCLMIKRPAILHLRFFAYHNHYLS